MFLWEAEVKENQEFISKYLNSERIEIEFERNYLLKPQKSVSFFFFHISRVLEGVNEVIDNILSGAEIDRDDIYEAVLVGNTAMHHFFHGIETIHLSASPFVPGRQSSRAMKARDAGIDISPGGYSYWLPNNGGWVGSDNVAVQLITGIYEREEMTLVIDIGTNGEVALGNREKALVTSTAAGPAFEGASIRHGMRARDGSIESVEIDPETLKPDCETINDKQPIGICGSGIVDAAAEMVRSGIVEKNGRFDKDKLGNPRIRRGRRRPGICSSLGGGERDKLGHNHNTEGC